MYKFAACISEGPLDVELTLRTPLGASILTMHRDLARKKRNDTLFFPITVSYYPSK